MQAYRRLSLEKILNIRDLGGWPIPGGATTRYGVFLRSALPEEPLPPDDRQALRELGLALDVDLRGDAEVAARPDALAQEPWLEYRRLPMFHEAAAGERYTGPSAFQAGFFWGEQYVVMAEQHKGWVRAVLEALAASPGPALFHCTTGKDRTGIIAAVLLGLCGVAREDIVADYSVSQCYLAPMYEGFLLTGEPGETRTLNAPFFSTAPANMETLLDHWDRQYGGVPGYAAACGLSQEVLRRLTGRLCGAQGK